MPPVSYRQRKVKNETEKKEKQRTQRDKEEERKTQRQTERCSATEKDTQTHTEANGTHRPTGHTERETTSVPLIPVPEKPDYASCPGGP